MMQRFLGVAWLALLGACTWASGAEMTQLAIVEDGEARNVAWSGPPWKPGKGTLEAAGPDRWLLANRGLGKGDFHITARLSVHGLRKSAARFSIGRGASSFGFEGNHGKIYITGILCKGPRTAGALGPPETAGIEDGKPFTFELSRQGNTTTVKVDGKPVHTVETGDGPLPVLGFEPRRATMRIEQFTVKGTLLPDVYEHDLWSVWFHPKVTPVRTKWHGPFLNLPDGRILTVVNNDGGVRGYTSRDDGTTWQPGEPVRKEGETFQIRDGNADTLLVRTKKGTVVLVFLNIHGQRVSWDYEKQEPKDDIRRFTWAARSLDDGKSWQDVQCIQKGYAGALRDILETSTGEVVVANQNVARNPGRHISYCYVSRDDGLTWARSNGMDIGGRGDHAGSIEGTLEELRDGRLWILLRSYHGHFYECFSADKGLAWTKPAASRIKASGSPGMLQRLASGRLVLLWNRFAKGRPRRVGRREELSMAFSEDDGKTWSEPVILARERGKRQSYPKLFERRPGELWIATWQGNQLFKLLEKDFAGRPAR